MGPRFSARLVHGIHVGDVVAGGEGGRVIRSQHTHPIGQQFGRQAQSFTAITAKAGCGCLRLNLGYYAICMGSKGAVLIADRIWSTAGFVKKARAHLS